MDGADWLRTQLTSFGCAACGQPFEMRHIRVLAERDGLFFVDLACTHCGSQAVAIVTIQVDDDGAHADVTELPAVAAGGEAASPAISADDVLAMHELLDGFEGSVTALLARPDPRRTSGSR